MREKLLRKAKRIDNGEWVEGYLFYRKDDMNPFMMLYDTNDEICEVDENTICLYTGHNDVNDKRIYEGDISKDEMGDIISVIRYDDENARFVIDDYGMTGALMEHGFDEDAGDFDVLDTNGFGDFNTPVSEFFNVIGNKFDNPELLRR